VQQFGQVLESAIGKGSQLTPDPA
ncbi:MAG: hypothetical protein QOG88_1478, partial [Actinomycetota bacterium]|nr:hypothetical protein [Actinomycetota bacterium]